MKKLLIAGIIALAVIAGAAFMFVTQQTAAVAAAPATPAASAAMAPQGSASAVAEAAVVPSQRAALSAQVGGRIAELLVKEGDRVESGALILRLDNSREKAAVAQAEAAFQRAQANLAQVQAGSRAEEIAVAEAAVETAKAQLARVQQGASAEEIAGGQAAVAAAQASLNGLLEGAEPGALTAARAEVANAQAAVNQAQAAYDKVKGNPDVGASREALALEQATNAYTAAVGRLSDLERGASKADIDGARARLNQAQSQLAALKAAARPADIAVAQAEVKRAEEQLALVKAGARPETIAAAQADVAAAKAALEQAQAVLAQMEVRAPFAGTIASLQVREGELLPAGAPIAQLADLTEWEIETVDLTELQVPAVRPGDTVRLTFDALPDLEMDGTVVRIGDLGENIKGDISYTVVIRPALNDARLKWNMTAAVTFGAN